MAALVQKPALPMRLLMPGRALTHYHSQLTIKFVASGSLKSVSSRKIFCCRIWRKRVKLKPRLMRLIMAPVSNYLGFPRRWVKIISTIFYYHCKPCKPIISTYYCCIICEMDITWGPLPAKVILLMILKVIPGWTTTELVMNSRQYIIDMWWRSRRAFWDERPWH